MPNIDIHWWAVVVAALVNMVAGTIWYSKVAFGKEWMKLTGRKMEEIGGAGMGYLLVAAASFLQAWILAHFVTYAGSTNFWDGLVTAFWLWLAFVAVVMATNMVFDQGRKWGLFKINAGYWLVVVLINGGILAAWR